MPFNFRKIKPSAVHRLIYAVLDLILYSNAWIAVCAVAMCFQTQLLLTSRIKLVPLGAFILFATLFLYALHRLVGLRKAGDFKTIGRYFVIERFRSHISFYALLAGLATFWYAWQLPWAVWWWMWPGVLVSLAYVLPVFGRSRRLRDFPYIKIFLISPAWSWITVLLPAVELNLLQNVPLFFIFLERLFFIFAISFPFDIRDLEIDRSHSVKTIPALLGLRKSKILAMVSLFLSAFFGWMAFRLDIYSLGGFGGLLSSLFLTAIVIAFTHPQRHDYYFTGLVDGMMVVQFVAIWLGMGMG